MDIKCNDKQEEADSSLHKTATHAQCLYYLLNSSSSECFLRNL